jgi:hypothetical protein
MAKVTQLNEPAPNPNILTVCISSGLFLVGRLIGGNKLTKPRIFSIIKEGREMQLSPLPGTPPFVRIESGGVYYTIPINDNNKSLYDLYERVTNPNVDPGVA